MDEIETLLHQIVSNCATLLGKIGQDKERGGLTATTDVVADAAERLFEDETPRDLPPYAEIAHGVRIGYEAHSDALIQLRRASLDPMFTADGQPQRSIELNAERLGTSRWLTIEIALEWDAVLRKRSAHLLVEAAASPATTISPKLRLPKAGGEFVDVSSGTHRFRHEPRIAVASMIPSEAEFADTDRDRPPSLVLFLGVASTRLNISRLFVW